MTHKSSRGKDGNSYHEFDCYCGIAQKVDNDHDTFVERLPEDVIDPRSHQVKRMMKQEVIGTIGTTQTRNQACCSRRNDMTRKIDVSLARRRKWCFGNKDPVAQLESSRQ